MSILSSIRIIEFEGIGPGPFCGMHLADLGAEVILIARPDSLVGPATVFHRGKKVVPLNLKDPAGIAAALRIAAGCDGLIEGLRPGVMERLGLGPDDVRAVAPRLVYGRVTGWGQEGPLSHAAGHDLNYVSLAGASWLASPSPEKGEPPAAATPPPTLVGDIGGGALYLALGLLSGILKARETGEGSVVDAAILDGAAHMTNLLLTVRASGGMPDRRGASMLDGADFYRVYRCADDRHITVGALEPKFYALFLQLAGLQDDDLFANQYDQSLWPARRQRLAEMFASKPSSHWIELFEGTDVCFAPVLNPAEAAAHDHVAARGIYRDVDGVLQTAAAPRFDGAPPTDPRPADASPDTARRILTDAGLTDEEIGALGGA